MLDIPEGETLGHWFEDEPEDSPAWHTKWTVVGCKFIPIYRF